MKFEKSLVNILFIVSMLLALCEARGGRRGGSFGGVFGSWRKYKKPSSGGGNSRRIVSSSPVHTPITKAWHDNKKSSTGEKFQKPAYNGYNSQPLPAGGSYYQNTAALPGNVVYVPQAPPRGAEFGNFLTGYLTGRLLTMGFPASHRHHVYRDSPAVKENDAKSNKNSPPVAVSSQQEMSSEKPFNASLIEFSSTTETFKIKEASTTTTASSLTTLSAAEPPAPPYGIICVPMLLNETNYLGETVQVERTVCYPAPAPPSPQKDMKSEPVEIAGDIMAH